VFTAWCRSLGITYQSNGRLLYLTSDEASMNALKDAIVRKLFMEWSVMTMTACVATERIQEFNRIPW
jgi:hypothetical protein